MNYLLFVLLCAFSAELIALVDLDKIEQSFVLETKRIHIPRYPDAFNPSIVRWENKLLMSFRSRNALDHQANLVGFIWLDENFDPLGEPQLLEMSEGSLANSYIQDPRLFLVKNKLHMAYSDLVQDIKSEVKKRTMCVAELKYDGERFSAINQEDFQEFDGDKNNKFEKNWVPFDYEGLMLLAYTISPSKIFLPIMGEKRCILVAQNSQFNLWNWGTLRGGTPALRIDNHYLSFFHSTTPLSTLQSESQLMPHYFMGAYLFEAKPPFAIKKISPRPIVDKTFYSGEAYQTWKPLKVIFPCGFIYDHQYIWVSYGRQDHEAWIVKLDKIELLKSLIPLESYF